MEVGRTGYCRVCETGGEGITLIRSTNDIFNGRLKALLSGVNNDFSPLDMGCPSPQLLRAGLPNFPIQISVSKLMDKKSQEEHPFSLLDVVHLPEFINDPIAVFRSATSIEDKKVVLTEMECEGINFVVIISPNRIIRDLNVNDIRSIYPRNKIKSILEWIVTDDLMEYHDKQKLLNWLGKQRSNPAEVVQLIKEATKIISNE